MPEFKELFKVEYDGSVSELTSGIRSLTGVEHASNSAKADIQKNATIDFEITYDNHETDRTQLANDIEDIDGVEEVIFG